MFYGTLIVVSLIDKLFGRFLVCEFFISKIAKLIFIENILPVAYVTLLPVGYVTHFIWANNSTELLLSSTVVCHLLWQFHCQAFAAAALVASETGAAALVATEAGAAGACAADKWMYQTRLYYTFSITVDNIKCFQQINARRDEFVRGGHNKSPVARVVHLS